MSTWNMDLILNRWNGSDTHVFPTRHNSGNSAIDLSAAVISAEMLYGSTTVDIKDGTQADLATGEVKLSITSAMKLAMSSLAHYSLTIDGVVVLRGRVFCDRGLNMCNPADVGMVVLLRDGSAIAASAD